MSSVFLSHSHADKPFARRLAADLRLQGHAVWIDEAEIEVGDSLIEKIREGLDQVDYVAAIISNNSIQSPWVTRELDIASNREIKEKRVVVLPLLLDRVPLPGFLEGKFFADFTADENYQGSLQAILRKLGPATPVPQKSEDEIARLQAQLAEAQARISQHTAALHAHEKAALHGKSPELVAAIQKANAKFPEHAPINTTYAFQVMGMVVTLDYLLWAIAKSARKGGHPLEVMFSLENKWPHVEAMIEAYRDLVDASKG